MDRDPDERRQPEGEQFPERSDDLAGPAGAASTGPSAGDSGAEGSGGGRPEGSASDAGEADADEFDAIVAGWRREGAPVWPGEADEDASGHPAAPEPAPPREPATVAPVAAEDDHFVPPEPPPLPRLGPPALVGLTLLALGLILVTSPGWVGVPTPYGLPLGLVALAAGLGWLVLRLWPDADGPAEGDGEDDGAVL